MARGRKPRAWVKIDCNGILRGSINWLLTLEEQAVWVKLIAYSEVCGGEPGHIEDNDGGGLPREFLSHELHCSMELLKTTIDKMEQNGSVKVNGTGSIFLVHFNDYQFTEYDRQKPYRQGQKGRVKAKELWDCPKCHYSMPIGKMTDKWVYCPLCLKKGKEVKLERRPNPSYED